MDASIKAHLPADKAITGVFTDRGAAEQAHELLRELGYDEAEISVLMSDEARMRYFPAPELKGELIGDSVQEGPGFGAAVGAGTGAVLGAMVAAAVSLAVPGVGVIIAGPLAAALAGAGVGGLTGGLLGSLIGVGIPEQQAKRYEEQINQGNILISVNPHSEAEERKITAAWQKAGGEIITPDVKDRY